MESPSFNTHCSNNIADIANRVVQELQVDKKFNDLISFSDDEVNEAEENTQEDEFEFPLIFSGLNLSDNIIDNDHISPRYPLFDRSLLLDLDSTFISNLDSKSAPAPAINEDRDTQATRLPLGKLLSEARKSIDQSSSLILESNDLNTISPETYCVWKPQEKEHQPPQKQHHSRRKHKKSKSISISELVVDTPSKRWKVRDLLKRSYSDDSKHTSCLATYSPPSKRKDGSSVVVFLPPISSKQNNEKVKKPEKALKTTASMGGNCVGTDCTTSHKPENKSPAYKAKIGNIRLPAFLPYRQNQHQLDAFANNHYKWVK